MIPKTQRPPAIVKWMTQFVVLSLGIVSAGGLAQAGFVPVVNRIGLGPAVISLTMLAFVIEVAMVDVMCLVGETAQGTYKLCVRLLGHTRTAPAPRGPHYSGA